jgi:hypothetical protein
LAVLPECRQLSGQMSIKNVQLARNYLHRLAKPFDLLHYWARPEAKPVKNMIFARFFFYFYFSYSSPKAVEKR